MTKGFKSAIPEIMQYTFNTGQNKFATQFMQSCNYLQRTLPSEGYLVTEMVRTGKNQVIVLPVAMDKNTPDAEDQKLIRAEEAKTIARRQLKLEDFLKKWCVTVYDQCFQEVQDKLEAMDD